MAIMSSVSGTLTLLGLVYANKFIEKSAAHLSGHTLAALVEEMEQYLAQLRRVSNGKQVSALEGSIREARQRLNSQRYEDINPSVPTHP